MPLIREGRNGSKYVFSESGYEENYQRIIRTNRWKLIYAPDKKVQKIMNNMPFELYDTQDDPDELNNLINIDTSIADKLKEDLFKWMGSEKRIDEVSSPKVVNVDKETENKLRSLGYVQ